MAETKELPVFESRAPRHTHLDGAKGSCTCGAVTYTFAREPLVVHCCHCEACQKTTGSAFALNILIEADNVRPTNGAEPGQLVHIVQPTTGGCGQVLARCAICQVCVWSYFGGAGPQIRFVRAGTLEPELARTIKPDVHIFTSTRVDWVQLPDGTPAFEGYYPPEAVWSKELVERRQGWAASAAEWMKANPKGYWKGKVEKVDMQEAKGKEDDGESLAARTEAVSLQDK